MHIKKTKQFVLLLFIMPLISGCAFSGYSTKNEILISTESTAVPTDHSATWSTPSGEVVSLAFNCAEKLHSFMISLLVPLPPIIPAWNNDDNNFSAIVSMPRDWQKTPPPLSIKLANGKSLPWSTEVERSGPQDAGTRSYAYYKFHMHCRLLDGATVEYIPATDMSGLDSKSGARRMAFDSKGHFTFMYIGD